VNVSNETGDAVAVFTATVYRTGTPLTDLV
jgi:hypothetical protein